MPRFSADELQRIGSLLFKAAGAPHEIAARVADSLVMSNLKGHDSHGIAAASGYVRKILAGGLDPQAHPTVLKEGLTTALIDGQWGFGQIAAEFATDVLVQKALDMSVSAQASAGGKRNKHVSAKECGYLIRRGRVSVQRRSSLAYWIRYRSGWRGLYATHYGTLGPSRTSASSTAASDAMVGPLLVHWGTFAVR